MTLNDLGGKDGDCVPQLFGVFDGYYMGYKPITLSCIFFMFIEIKFIDWHSRVMFAMKFIRICNN